MSHLVRVNLCQYVWQCIALFHILYAYLSFFHNVAHLPLPYLSSMITESFVCNCPNQLSRSPFLSHPPSLINNILYCLVPYYCQVKYIWLSSGLLRDSIGIKSVHWWKSTFGVAYKSSHWFIGNVNHSNIILPFVALFFFFFGYRLFSDYLSIE